MAWYLKIRIFVFLFVALAFCMPVQAVNIAFTPSEKNFANPERGFWRMASDDFARIENEDLKWVVEDNLKIIYALVRLDQYRNVALPDEFLSRLQNSFDKSKIAGVKLILRFAYNYPKNSHDYDNAKDAPLEIVLSHIKQLAPIIKVNADLILVWEAGFIGAWGEGHTSSNGLENLMAKKAVLDALREVAGNEIYLAWRYPADLMTWFPVIKKTTKIGIHNDCFLSSNTDVGTYDEDQAIRNKQREFIANLSAITPFVGETCDAQKRYSRLDCKAILQEGAMFNLVSLGLDYDRRFHKKWKKQGCNAEVTNKLGYRIELLDADAPNELEQGEGGEVFVNLRNSGWSKMHRSRALVLIARNKVSKEEYKFIAGDVADILPNEMMGITFELNLPKDATKGEYELSVSAPDASARLAKNSDYSVRFANENNEKLGQGWNNEDASFAMGLVLELR